jgi:hypothetical protein
MAAPLKPLQPDREFDPRRAARQALGLSLGLCLAHTIAVWGYTGLFWGAHGRWLHAVERFALGETPYRDFQWHDPPLALWVAGSAAKLLGTSVPAVALVTATVMLLLFLAYQRLLARIAAAVAVPIVLASFVFATAYAARSGVPLPLGTTAAAGPLGALFLVLALTGVIGLMEDRPLAVRPALLAGIAAGLAVLSKHDFWLPAIVIVSAGVLALARQPEPVPAGVRRSLPGAFLATVTAGVLLIILSAGPAAAGHLVVGWGQTAEWFGSGLPSAERLTVQLAATAALGLVGVAALWLSLAVDDRRAGRLVLVFLLLFLSASAVHVGMSVGIMSALSGEPLGALPTPIEESLRRGLLSGRRPVVVALGLLDSRFQLFFFPAILPPLLVAALAAWWRRWPDPALRGRALLLLLVATTLRLSRGFAGSEWYHVLIEIPAYAVFLRLVAGVTVRGAQRTVSAALAIVLLVGVYTYHQLGRGPLTRQVYPAFSTPRGRVAWAPSEQRDYARVRAMLDSLDPGGRRPLFAFGATGGWNYFLRRPNPWRVTRGLYFSDVDAAEVAAAVARHTPPPLLLDNRHVLGGTPAPRISPFRWDVVMRPSAHARADRSTFEAMIAGCAAFPAHPDPVPSLVVYDCAAGAPGVSADSAAPVALTPPDSSR